MTGFNRPDAKDAAFFARRLGKRVQAFWNRKDFLDS